MKRLEILMKIGVTIGFLVLAGVALNVVVIIFHWGDGDQTLCTLRDGHDGNELWKANKMLTEDGWKFDRGSWSKSFKGGCNLAALEKKLQDLGFSVARDPNHDQTWGQNPPVPEGQGLAGWPWGKKPTVPDPGKMPGADVSWPGVMFAGLLTLAAGFGGVFAFRTMLKWPGSRS